MQLPTVIAISICLSMLPDSNPAKVRTIYNRKVNTSKIAAGNVPWYNWPGVRPLQESLGSCKHLLQHYHKIDMAAAFQHKGSNGGTKKVGVGKRAIAIVGHYGGNTLNGLGILHCLWEYGYQIGYFKIRLHTPVEDFLYMPEDKRIIVEQHMAGLFNAGMRWPDVVSFLNDLEDGIVMAKGRKMAHIVQPGDQPEEMVASAFALLDNAPLHATSYKQSHEEYLQLEQAALSIVLAKGPRDFISIIIDFEIEYNSTQLASRDAFDAKHCAAAKQKLLAENDATIDLDAMFGSGGEGPRVHPKAYCGFKFMRDTRTDGRDLAGVDGISGQCFVSSNPDISKLSSVDKGIFGANVAVQKLLIPIPNLNLAVNQFDPQMPLEMLEGQGTLHFLTMPKCVFDVAASSGNAVPTYTLDIGGECIVEGEEGNAAFSRNPYTDLQTLRAGLFAMTTFRIANQ